MCGIAGVVTPRAEREAATVKRMVAALRHRGPDDEGTILFESCGLGHARLSIVDLSTGHQPMYSADRQTAVVFNGEIYGYQALRRALGDYPFRTSSDTELILALYDRHGTRCLDQLPGMFAFAIWDERTRTLFAARDRFGEKPFYYAFGRGGEFIFASEIKGILASGLVDPVIDPTSVAHYLKYLYVDPERTIYANVFTLPPAHRLLLRDGRVTVERYWSFPRTLEKVDLGEAVEQFKHLFSSAVERQLIADVPVGAFLSGGLDSSTVVAVASEHKSRLRTFSFGFEDAVSELPFADGIARKYGTDHRELTAEKVDLAELILLMRDIYDEPFADSSNIPTYLISKLARQHLKVVLTGDGADELLGGYGWWYMPIQAMIEASNMGAVRRGVARLIARILARARGREAAKWRWRTAGLEASRRYRSVVEAHRARPPYFSDGELEGLLLRGYSAEGSERTYSWRPTDTLNDAMAMDLEEYMPGDILVKTDRASMANGLELRSPFLDVDFASFCVSLPSMLKIREGRDKWILREAYASSWTEEVRSRGKQGFGAPVQQWLRRPSMRALREKYLGNPNNAIFALLSYPEVQKRAQHEDYQTWSLLVLALWMEKYESCVRS